MTTTLAQHAAHAATNGHWYNTRINLDRIETSWNEKPVSGDHLARQRWFDKHIETCTVCEVFGAENGCIEGYAIFGNDPQENDQETETMKTFNQYLTRIARETHHDYMTSGNSGEATPDLIADTLENMPACGAHLTMERTALDAVDNVLNVATNNGTVENMFELRQVLEHDAGTYGVSIEPSEAMKLAGELWNQSYRPESYDHSNSDVIGAVIDAWLTDIGDAAMNAVINYFETNAPETN